VSAVQRFQRLPGSVQVAGAAATVLIGGTLAPWIDYGRESSFLDFAAGFDLNGGEISQLVGALVIFLLSRMAKQGRTRDGGAIAALGLLACGVVAVTGIRVHEGDDSIGWGMWVSAAAAVTLLLSGLALFDTNAERLPPPD
jgi:hypothetical protein